jgi:hypothetical protein
MLARHPRGIGQPEAPGFVLGPLVELQPDFIALVAQSIHLVIETVNFLIAPRQGQLDRAQFTMEQLRPVGFSYAQPD